MLINFKVSNFRSFDDEQVFSMEAGKARAHSDRVYSVKKSKLLKFMAVYGANASGKTNLIKALDYSKHMIIHGLSSDYSECYCKLVPENAEHPSTFEYTIELNGKQFRYGFAVILKTRSIVKEWLYELTYGNNYKIVFERNILEKRYIVNYYFKNESINERLAIYADDIKEDDSIPFLLLMNQNKVSFYDSFPEAKVYQEVWKWFRHTLSVNAPDRPITNYTYIFNAENIERISQLMSMFSTGISAFKLVTISFEKIAANIPKELLKDITDRLLAQQKELAAQDTDNDYAVLLRDSSDNSMFILRLNENGEAIAQTFQFNHHKTNAFFSLKEESDGTVRLLDLIEILLTANDEKVYVIDEINRRFHPLLTYRFVEEYLKIAADQHVQLIVSTHESRLMDLNLLRKDEISFVNKSKTGCSQIYSLEKFGERFDKKIATAYLHGAYDAIPVFDSPSE